MSKNTLYKQPQYAARHDDAFDARHAQVSGEAAAGMLSDDHSTPSNFPQHNIYNADDLAEMYRQENIFVALYRRINKMIHGGE